MRGRFLLLWLAALAPMGMLGMGGEDGVIAASDAFSHEREAAVAGGWASPWLTAAVLVAGVAAAAVFLLTPLRRLDGAPSRPMVVPPIGAAALLLAMLVLGPVGAMVAANVLGLIDAVAREQTGLAGDAQIMIGQYLGVGVVLMIYLALSAKAASLSADRRSGPCRALALGVGGLAFFWPMVLLLAWIISTIVALLTGEPPEVIGHTTLAQLVAGEPDVWFFIVIGLVVIAAPVAEEVLYRGLLQDALRRIGAPPWTAIMIVSTIFAVMHIGAAPSTSAIPGLVIPLFLLSLGFGWVYEKTGRLAAPIVMHALFNAGNLAAAMWLE